MKNLVLALMLVFIAFHIKAQYTTPGTGVTWDMEDLVSNSAGAAINYEDGYLIDSDINISLNDTIRLVSNEIIYFSESILITVLGTFQADPPDQIVFTAKDTTLNYKGFRFEDSDNSYFKNCILEFGGGTDILNSDMIFDNCLIRKNDKSNSTGAIDLFHSSPTIQFCDIRSNAGPAILSGATSECSPFISGNTMYRNNTENTNMPQINLGTSDGINEILIQDNNIEGYYDQVGGIAITTLAGGNLDAIIDGNLIINNRYGITAYGGNISSVISNNFIQDNNIQGDPMLGGSGINYFGDLTNQSVVSENIISGNLWGITIQNQAIPNLGQVDVDTVNIGENYFYNNGNGGELHALYNNTPNDLFAQNNYWGSLNADSVEAVIFHQPDDPTLGFVNYLPLLDTITTSITNIEYDEKFLVYPNPVETVVKFKKPEVFKSNKSVKLIIINTNGSVVFQKKSEKNLETLDLSSFEPGIYIARFTNGEIVMDEKFIKY